MRIKWLRQALLNLDQEAEYLAQESPEIAGEFVRHIQTSTLILREYPNAGRPGRISGTRELVISRFPYIVPYRIRNDAIELLRVFHTSRKWPKKL